MSTTLARGLTAVLSLTAGCSLIYGSDLDREQCTQQSDCEKLAAELGSPLVCRTNACQRPLCASTTDCPTSTTCVANQCVANAPDAGRPMIACTQDAECGAGNRCGFDGFCYAKWGCLDTDRDWPTAPPTLRYSTVVRNIAAIEDPTKLEIQSVTACATIDPNCETPQVAWPQDVTIASDGLVQASFKNVRPAGFIGYMKILARNPVGDAGVADAGADAGPTGIMPAYVHFTGETPIAADFRAQARLVLIDATLFRGIAALTGVPFDINAATLALQVHDCGGRRANGVSLFSAEAREATFVPIQAETVPVVGGTKTTEDGAAIVINLPKRGLTFTLRDEDENRVLSDDITFITQGAAINYLLYYPRFSAQQKWTAEARRLGLVQ